GESVSGSAPNITATAVVNAPGSPMHGRTIVLLNTERRFLRPGSAGTKEANQNLSHGHTGTAVAVGDHSHGGVTRGFGPNGEANGWGPTGSGYTPINASSYGAGAHGHALSINNDGGNEARPNNIGVRIYRRVG